MLFLASLAIAAATGLFGWVIVSIRFQPRVVDEKAGRFESERREEIRAANPIYRWCEPLIDEWGSNWPVNPSRLSETEQQLLGAGIRLRWTPAEYVNVKRLESLFVGTSCFLIGMTILTLGVVSSLLLGVAAFYGYDWLLRRSLKSQAIVRQMKMKRRFAVAIDLMALMMEVGAGFQECLEVAARESKATPLGEELSLVEKEIRMGSLRSKALMGLADRTRDSDMREVILSINEGEELGTPLTTILRNQADQMRQKRSQWAEKAAEESQVAIVFPAMLIMVACLLIVVAPFVLTIFPI